MRYRLLLITLFIVSITATGLARQGAPFAADRVITVMTQNLYSGVDAEIFAVPAAVSNPQVGVFVTNCTMPSTLVGPITCCQAPHLDNYPSSLSQRIDFVFFRGLWTALASNVGQNPEDRTPSLLWPSDHAGIVVKLKLPSRDISVRSSASDHIEGT